MFGEIDLLVQKTIGFIPVPDFTLMSAAAAIEPLRAASLVAGTDLFMPSTYRPTGGMLVPPAVVVSRRKHLGRLPISWTWYL